jgi:hypothetical protein
MRWYLSLLLLADGSTGLSGPESELGSNFVTAGYFPRRADSLRESTESAGPLGFATE